MCLTCPLIRLCGFVVFAGERAPYLVADCWPGLRAAWWGSLNRWPGAAALLAAGVLYAAVVFAILQRWVLTDAEKQKGREMVRRGVRVFRGGEATA